MTTTTTMMMTMAAMMMMTTTTTKTAVLDVKTGKSITRMAMRITRVLRQELLVRSQRLLSVLMLMLTLLLRTREWWWWIERWPARGASFAL